MKAKIQALAILLALSSATTFTQAVWAEPSPPKSQANASFVFKKNSVTLTRKALQQGERTSAVINYPTLASGASDSITKSVNNVIGVKAALDMDLAGAKQEFTESFWLSEVNYKITYQGPTAVSVFYTIDGIGAHPSTSFREVCADLKTGRQLKADDMFQNKKALQAHLNGLLSKEMQASVKAAGGADKDTISEYFSEQKPTFSKSQLEHFVITPQGLTFRYDYDMPHVIKALEPKGSFELSWKTLNPWLKPAWVLGKV